MSAVKGRSLSSLFLRSGPAVKIKSKPKTKHSSSSSSSCLPKADDANPEQHVSSLGAFTSQDATKRPINSLLRSSNSTSGNCKNQLPDTIRSLLKSPILDNSPDLLEIPGEQEIPGERSLEKELDVSLFGVDLKNNISSRRKEVSRQRKQKWIFKSSQENRFNSLVRMCAEKLGTETAVEVFGKMGKETGVKEYNALINICVKNAKDSIDEEVALQQIHKAFLLFKSIKEQGFQLEEETYGPFLGYLIEMGMVKEFHFFCEVIKGENPCSLSRLGYYEMLLWIRVDNKEKIQELCNYVMTGDGENKLSLLENYLLALCESERKKELLQILEVVDVTKFSSVECIASIFNILGKLIMESFAENLFMALRACDYGEEKITKFIYSYVVGIPNLAVEDVISNFKNLHVKLEVSLSCASYEKLIAYCCDSHEVHVALDLVDEICQKGLDLSIEVLHSIFRAMEETSNFNLVHRVYSVICHQTLKPNNETFRLMITLCVKMKDFDGAYGMLNDLEKMNLRPTANMYNAILGGYFREKNTYSAKKLLKQMEEADVKRDSLTYCYLLSNCESEDDIKKYYEEMKRSGIDDTKHVFMALINAYASLGQFEKAKQVVSDKGISDKSWNEINSALAQALSENGQWFDALDIYKQIGSALEPKAVISLIENVPSDGELSTLLKLLEEINASNYWVDGCCRVILYCVRYKHLSPAINLLKQLRDKFCNDELVHESLFDEVFCLIGDSDPTYLQMGLDLLRVVKNDFGITPSRKCLDFLLHACVNAKDLRNSKLVWKEYKEAGLPYNILNFLRMYQAFLAAGDHKAAKIFLTHVPKDDPDVRRVIRECETSYSQMSIYTSETEKKKKNRSKTRI
ncbi:pentatricopeptide repeat-containing protein At4g04790, mitochondrial [Ziziphus jujuba]|uniref:Pentatricopeptide repeat-containing protein At4g04790, mitochondrial n=1 Tax=Ziziphus jujuba TaxID=326968 RepID=A0A6P4AJF5_ZIZJJ|nr:pentatricopeptide repeat-containing protein At4g04790, mitochondrial [Ziziphus jujuba]